MSGAYNQYDYTRLEGKHLFPPLGRWYFASSGSRLDPSFFIIGVQKGGTTSLSQYLIQHPQIITPQRKDIYFFNNLLNYKQGSDWYKAHFPHRGYRWWYELRYRTSDSITFDPTPNYFSAPGAAERLAKHYPNTKLILLLRNPTERAWSNYRMSVYHGFEHLSFEESLEAETRRMEEEKEKSQRGDYHSYVMQRLAYRTQGEYVRFLEEWLKHFKRDQFLILRSEDLFSEPAKIYSEVVEFLGLKKFTLSDFEKFNSGKIEKEMPATIRRELCEYFRPFNSRLYELIGRDMNWN